MTAVKESMVFLEGFPYNVTGKMDQPKPCPADLDKQAEVTSPPAMRAKLEAWAGLLQQAQGTGQ
jgi:hypothetical protein